VERAFGDLRTAETIPRNPGRVTEQVGERRATIEYEVHVPLLYAGWQAPPSGHADADALDVTSQILSGGRSSRLYRQLVHESEQALSADVGYWELQGAGLFYGVAQVRPGVAVEAVETAFFAEIDKIRDEGVSVDEVTKAKRQLEVGLVNGLTTSHALASRVGRDTVYFGRVRSLEERLSSIAAVTPEDVQRVVATYLVSQKRNVVHVVSPAKGRAEPAQEEGGS